jgi:hypothetical protein
VIRSLRRVVGSAARRLGFPRRHRPLTSQEFASQDFWRGSWYELAIPLYAPSPGTVPPVPEAIAALWSHPSLSGPWADRNDYPDADRIVRPLSGTNEYGVLRLPDGEVGCLTCLVPEEDSDWLDLCIPSAMLSRLFDVQYPTHSRANSWLKVVDAALVSIGERIYEAAPYPIALVGEEASGSTDREAFTAELVGGYGLLLEPEFAIQRGVEAPFTELASGLRWYPPAHY